MAIQANQFSPGVLSLLPLFYIGWSDSILSPSEMKLMHKKINAMPFLSKEDKAYLVKYSNPGHPPTKEIFSSWLEALRYFGKSASLEEKKNLTSLGLEIAKSSTRVL